AFHRANLGMRPTAVATATLWRLFTDRWPEADLSRVARLARGREDEALEWLDVAYPQLRETGPRLVRARVRRTLLHLDTRSDNLRVRRGLRLFDWNFACVGPRELDVAAFAQSITAAWRRRSSGARSRSCGSGTRWYFARGSTSSARWPTGYSARCAIAGSSCSSSSTEGGSLSTPCSPASSSSRTPKRSSRGRR